MLFKFAIQALKNCYAHENEKRQERKKPVPTAHARRSVLFESTLELGGTAMNKAHGGCGGGGGGGGGGD